MAFAWPYISISLDCSQQSAGDVPMLLNLSPRDCARLHSSLGDHLNLGFFAHCMRCIVGAPGDLYGLDGQTVDTTITIESLAANHLILGYCFKLADPTTPVENTFIPLTELSRAASVGSSQPSDATSLHTGEAPSQLSNEALEEIGLQLGPHAEMKFERASKSTRQERMRRDTAARDGGCRLTGSELRFCDAAHLFKACNPDQSLISMLYTRRHLYPGLEEQISEYKRGRYDPKIAIMLLGLLHSRALDTNDLAIYLAPSEVGSNLRRVFALPLDDGVKKRLDMNQESDEPRFSDPTQHAFEPTACLWDWLFASRMLGKYGTRQAQDIAERSPLVRAVSSWRSKVAVARANKRQKLE